MRNHGEAKDEGARNSASAGARRRSACVAMVDADETPVFVEGHDDALLGVVEVNGELRAAYDSGAIVRALMRRDGMDRQGALDFLEYNIASAFGERSPVFVARAS